MLKIAAFELYYAFTGNVFVIIFGFLALLKAAQHKSYKLWFTVDCFSVLIPAALQIWINTYKDVNEVLTFLLEIIIGIVLVYVFYKQCKKY